MQEDKYICFRHFKRKNGQNWNIHFGEKLIVIDGDFLALEKDRSKVICYRYSDVAKHFFAINNDNNGIERGKLTYSIAYNPKFHLNEKQKELICKDYQHYLRQDVDTILFNTNFFEANLYDLKILKERLQYLK